MKRIFSVVLVIFLLTGCTADATKIKPVTNGISFLCDITYYNETYNCEGDIQKNGDSIIKFISPSRLQGLKERKQGF